jgi:hypothetical protein
MPDCVLAALPSRNDLLVVNKKARHPVAIPRSRVPLPPPMQPDSFLSYLGVKPAKKKTAAHAPFPDAVLGTYAPDAALLSVGGELVRVDLPSGKGTCVWRPRPDEVPERVGYLAFWDLAPCGSGRVVVCTPRRLLVLQDQGREFCELAELAGEPKSVRASADGRFLVVEENTHRYAVVAVPRAAGRLKKLAGFKSYLRFFHDPKGQLVAGTNLPRRMTPAEAKKWNARERYYRLAGLESLRT